MGQQQFWISSLICGFLWLLVVKQRWTSSLITIILVPPLTIAEASGWVILDEEDALVPWSLLFVRRLLFGNIGYLAQKSFVTVQLTFWITTDSTAADVPLLEALQSMKPSGSAQISNNYLPRTSTTRVKTSQFAWKHCQYKSLTGSRTLAWANGEF